MKTNFSFKKMTQTLLTTSLVLALGSPALAQSKEGTNSGGGGNSVNGTLLDFYESQDTGKYKDVLTKYLKKADAILEPIDKTYIANFKELVLQVFNTKRIIISTENINNSACLNSGSLVQTNKVVVACQNSYELRININNFLKLDEVSRVGLFVHEGLLALRFSEITATNKEQIEYQVRELNRRIHDGSLMNIYGFSTISYDLGFDVEFIGRSDADFNAKYMANNNPCGIDNKLKVSTDSIQQLFDKSGLLIMDGYHTRAFRSYVNSSLIQNSSRILDALKTNDTAVITASCESINKVQNYWENL